jgi:flagellar hook protein FlgE
MTDGAKDMSFNWNLWSGSTPSITQTVGTSTATASTQDGFASGSYNGFSVNSAGVISASFSNGQTETIGQIAVASVTNVEGLTDVNFFRCGDSWSTRCWRPRLD